MKGSVGSLVGGIAIFIFLWHVTHAKDLTVTILHTNDVHARFIQTSKYSGSCSTSEAEANLCFGGFPRLHSKVSEIRRETSNVLYLSGGDYFQGTIWYTLLKSPIVSRFVNILNHTVMSLGNHEFDDDIEEIVEFLDAVTFPIISSNIDDTLEPTFQGKIKKSLVVSLEGVDIGIIGYTTKETPSIAKPGNLIFNDEVASINAEAQRLHDSGIKIMIALGHAGYGVDMSIAEKCPLIDVVVGGHTHSFLYNGAPPDIEEPLGDYPTVVTQSSGKKIPVVQAYAFGKYLGFLNVTFNDDGDVTFWEGNPILLDWTVAQDPELLETLTEINDNLTMSFQQEIGKTHVFLNGSTTECRLRECNMGNLIADSMVFGNLKYPDELFWSDVTMSLLGSGGVRASIDEQSKNWTINIEDCMTVLPFGNTIDLIEIKGQFILQAFEHSVAGYSPIGSNGKFLQVSGMRVVYDLNEPDYSRVKSLHVLCKQCRVPKYEPIQLDEIYKVVVQNFLADGGDGYTMIRDNIIQRHETGIVDFDLLIEYIKSRSPIIQGIEGRVVFYEDSCPSIPSTLDPETTEMGQSTDLHNKVLL